jgi:hypothetical protein
MRVYILEYRSRERKKRWIHEQRMISPNKEKDICNHNNKEWNHRRNDITIVNEEKKRRPGGMWGLARNKF